MIQIKRMLGKRPQVAAGAKKDADAGRKAVAAGAETTDAQGIDAERKLGHTEASGVSTLEAEVAARETALQGALREQKMYLSVLKVRKKTLNGGS